MSVNGVIVTVPADKMLEVFTDHYSKLQNILPINNLSGHFVSERIITFEEEQVIQQTVVQSQAASIVLRKIANSLKAGHTRSFDKLLSIMKDHGGLSCEELANQIRGELSKNTSGSVTWSGICSVMYFLYYQPLIKCHLLAGEPVYYYNIQYYKAV